MGNEDYEIPDEPASVYGHSLDDIDEIASEVFSLLADQHLTSRLSVLALCRAIAMIGTEEDLDVACAVIDQFSDDDDEDNEGWDWAEGDK